MHKLTCYPIGNANCILIELDNGQLILFDYANPGDPENDEDKRIDTAAEIKAILKAKNRTNIDVVVFTHIDLDHIGGAADLFYLEHAKKYQDDDRIKIDTLWIPAGVILEEGTEDEARIVRAEACYRLRQGKGIRVFSRPKKLESWLNKQNPKLTLEDRKHLIDDAGKCVPGFSKDNEGVEFFLHSPFATRQNDNEVIDRNGNCIVVQATFLYNSIETKVILTGDIDQEALDNIIQNTKRHENEDRLKWDIYLIPHHCSYKSLNEKEKGISMTIPTEDIKWLLEQGDNRGIIISSSKPIPKEDTTQPPHRQAANYYKKRAKDIDGEFVVTMEHPKVSVPKPLVITMDSSGATVKKQISYSTPLIVTKSTPRAG